MGEDTQQLLQAWFGDSLLGSPLSPAADSPLSSGQALVLPCLHPPTWMLHGRLLAISGQLLFSASTVSPSMGEPGHDLFSREAFAWAVMGTLLSRGTPLAFKCQHSAWGSTAPSLSGEDYDGLLCPHQPAARVGGA